MEKQCKYCKSTINKDAAICPHCRKRLKTSFLTKLILILFAVPFLFGIFFASSNKTTGQSTADKIDKFDVQISKFYEKRNYIWVVGHTKNNTDRPAAAQLKLTCYDSKNNVVKVEEFWPDSIKNIAPNTKSSFEYMFEKVPNIKRYEAQIVDVRTWP